MTQAVRYCVVNVEETVLESTNATSDSSSVHELSARDRLRRSVQWMSGVKALEPPTLTEMEALFEKYAPAPAGPGDKAGATFRAAGGKGASTGLKVRAPCHLMLHFGSADPPPSPPESLPPLPNKIPVPKGGLSENMDPAKKAALVASGRAAVGGPGAALVALDSIEQQPCSACSHGNVPLAPGVVQWGGGGACALFVADITTFGAKRRRSDAKRRTSHIRQLKHSASLKKHSQDNSSRTSLDSNDPRGATHASAAAGSSFRTLGGGTNGTGSSFRLAGGAQHGAYLPSRCANPASLRGANGGGDDEMLSFWVLLGFSG